MLTPAAEMQKLDHLAASSAPGASGSQACPEAPRMAIAASRVRRASRAPVSLAIDPSGPGTRPAATAARIRWAT